MRYSFFKIVGFDLSYSLPCMNRFFFKMPQNSRLNPLRVQCVIRRDHLFEDGVKALKVVGPGILRMDVRFDGELGIGFGPTQEFFTDFGHEVLRLDIWRSDRRLGLFPRPDAARDTFWLLGLLCGKALLMDILVPIPFSAAFLKLVLGDPVDVAEVDPEFAGSLNAPDGLIGLPCTYPGIPAMRLLPDAIVDARNLGSYVGAVRKATVELPDIVAEFRRGLSAVVQWELLRLFDAGELARVFGGEPVRITRDDLVASVVVSHGYTDESPQIGMFFDVVAEFDAERQMEFVMFVTGSGRLPFGGLRAMSPRLTVALRTADSGTPDEQLPSVMTCANYLKLPAYSCKEVMGRQLSTAIAWAQKGFMLT
jgi:E3 ubiquitin-protein ligase TRIP12